MKTIFTLLTILNFSFFLVSCDDDDSINIDTLTYEPPDNYEKINQLQIRRLKERLANNKSPAPNPNPVDISGDSSGSGDGDNSNNTDTSTNCIVPYNC